MVVICYRTIREFGEAYPNALESLTTWYEIVSQGDFATFNELRRVFNSVDAVGDDLYVFNIKGNHYRLIVRIHFSVRTVSITFVGTHNQYNKIDLTKL